MKRYGEDFTLDGDEMDAIATYMNDEIREQVHAELAPCTEEEFLSRYCERDLNFEEFLGSEFGIEL